MLQQLLLLLHVLVSVSLVALVLLQQGKGAELGASLGSGASQTVFGSQGASSFLFKLTGFLALLFFVTSLSLGYLAAHTAKQSPIQRLSTLQQMLHKKSVPANKQPITHETKSRTTTPTP